ncbi:hypothetical protein [Chitinophaga sp.]|uniref:hypothetical protein n=1 Tax=Chitinophaga sp. TaxID=1869181 RepID=UPI002F939A7F
MNKLVLSTALCLLSLKMSAQDINENLRKQHLSVRGAITTKDWILRGPVKSLKECTYGYGPTGQKETTYYCNNTDYSTAGLLLKQSYYNNKEKNTTDSRYYYSNNHLDSITGFQKKVYQYDEHDKLEKIISYGFYDENRNTMVMEEVFGYDKKGMIVKSTQTVLPDKTVTHFNYAYNKNGDLTEHHLVTDGNDILYVNEFDTKGPSYRTKIIYAKAPDNNSFSSVEINKQGDISAMTSSQKNKATLRTYQYEYDAQGNWFKQTVTENGQLRYSIVRTISYYPTGSGDVITTAAPDMPVVKPPLMPAEVVDSFVAALNQRQYARAYAYCTGGRWGTVAQFSSVNMYGGITAARMLESPLAPLLTGQPNVDIAATVYVEDPVNGSGTFVQQFQLQKKDSGWKIAGIKLISSTRPSDNWSLNVPAQPDLTREKVIRLASAVYDTVSLVADIGDGKDSINRELDTLRFFKDDKTLYCVAVFANQGPQFGASTGWCDMLLFAKTGNKWQLQTFLLNAGGGGMYGYSGRFGKLLRMGDEHVAIVLKGGLTHMGENVSWSDIVAFHRGKLQPVAHITTDYDYDNGSGSNARCYEVKYRFERNGKPVYDLLLERYRCDSKVPVGKAAVTYANGYTLPELFNESN